MATNSNISAKYMGGMDQTKSRDHAVWFDQHRNSSFTNALGERPFADGRAWWSVIEIRSGHPSGPVHPLEWAAPFDVPQQYVTDGIGRSSKLVSSVAALAPVSTKTDRIRIRYEDMLRDDKERALEHWRLCVANATRHNLPIPQFGAEVDYRLLELAGPESRSPLIAQALLAGNPWLLGQQMPTRDPVTNAMVVEEDEQLARLLRRSERNALMPQDVAGAVARGNAPEPVPDTVRELVAEMAAMRERLQELEGNRTADATRAAKRGPGRPPKAAAAGV